MKTIKILTGFIAIVTTILTLLIGDARVVDQQPVFESVIVPAIISGFYIGFTILAKNHNRSSLFISIGAYLFTIFILISIGIVEANTLIMHWCAGIVLLLLTLFTKKRLAV